VGVTSVSGFDGLADHGGSTRSRRVLGVRRPGGRTGTLSEERATYERAVTTLALAPRR